MAIAGNVFGIPGNKVTGLFCAITWYRSRFLVKVPTFRNLRFFFVFVSCFYSTRIKSKNNGFPFYIDGFHVRIKSGSHCLFDYSRNIDNIRLDFRYLEYFHCFRLVGSCYSQISGRSIKFFVDPVFLSEYKGLHHSSGNEMRMCGEGHGISNLLCLFGLIGFSSSFEKNHTNFRSWDFEVHTCYHSWLISV